MESELSKLHLKELTELSKLQKSAVGIKVRVRGFISTVRRTAKLSFITLRDQLETIQCVLTSSSEAVGALSTQEHLVPEAFLELFGEVKATKLPVKSCSIKSVEINVESFKIISAVTDTLPFSLKDAGASEEERTSNPSLCIVSYSHRLDNRFLDFRIPASQAIIRVLDGTMNAFREYLRKHKFTEIKTTKIIGSGSEGGANLFSMKYFNQTAYLAQSPQLYKQLAIAGGLKRVFEIGHVYRAEESNINRYLSEFTGVDLEMELTGSYIDVIHFIYGVFVHVFDTLRTEYSRELEVVRRYKGFTNIVYNKDPVIITYAEAAELLRSSGVELEENADFSREAERKLGALIKSKHGVDFFVVRDYPTEVRAFYTYSEPGSQYSHSYDFILRGEEILSGAERIVDFQQLSDAVAKKGIPYASLQFYIDAFKYGVPPHAGCGIGLERTLKSYFNFDDIRYFALFPRDPKRLYP